MTKHIVSYLIIAMLLATVVTAQSIHVTELQGLYRFENASNLGKDSSGKNNNGVATTVTSVASKGTNKTGSLAADFDGTAGHSITVPNVNNNFSFFPLKPFSFGAWVNMDDATTFRLGGVRESGAQTEWFFTIDGSDFARWQIHDNTTGGNLGQVTSATQTSFENTWIHYVVTYDGGTIDNGLKLYRNGQIITSGSSSPGTYTSMRNTFANFEIGSINNQTAVADGSMDEVFVINQELSQPQIASIFNLGFNFTLIDTTPPVIHNEQVNNTDLTCGDTVLLQANVTDNNNVSQVRFIYTDFMGAHLTTATKFGATSLYRKTITYTHNNNFTRVFNFTIVNATDSNGNRATTNPQLAFNYTCIDDIELPIISHLSPVNGSLVIQPASVTITETCEDTTLDSFNLTIQNSTTIVFQQANTSIPANTSTISTTLNTSLLGTGTYTTQSYCSDTSNNTNELLTQFTVVDFIPIVVNLTTPLNNSEVSYIQGGSSTLGFSFIVNQVATCDLYLSGSPVQTGVGVSAGSNTIQQALAPSAPTNSTIEWFIRCTATDTASSAEHTLSVVVLPPVGNEYNLYTCPNTTTTNVLFFALLLLIPFALFVISFAYPIGASANYLFGGISLFSLLLLSVPLYFCAFFLGVLMSAVGITIGTATILRAAA